MLMCVCVLAPGDRSHIPESTKPAYEVLAQELNRMKQTTPVCSPSLSVHSHPNVSGFFSPNKNA